MSKVVELKKNQKAPFDGDLFPPKMTEAIWIDAQAKEAFKLELLTCRNDKADCITAQESDGTKWFGAGAVIGTLVVLLIQNVGK